MRERVEHPGVDIRRRRIALRKSGREIARLAGVNAGGYCTLETHGEGSPRLIERIEQALSELEAERERVARRERIARRLIGKEVASGGIAAQG